MFGSKNSELTRKYSSTWLEAITFGFSSRLRVWNSQKPMPAKASARSTSAPPPQGAGAPRRRLAGPSRAQSGHEPGHGARADHHVERDEQVRRAPARLH